MRERVWDSTDSENAALKIMVKRDVYLFAFKVHRFSPTGGRLSSSSPEVFPLVSVPEREWKEEAPKKTKTKKKKKKETETCHEFSK